MPDVLKLSRLKSSADFHGINNRTVPVYGSKLPNLLLYGAGHLRQYVVTMSRRYIRDDYALNRYYT